MLFRSTFFWLPARLCPHPLTAPDTAGPRPLPGSWRRPSPSPPGSLRRPHPTFSSDPGDSSPPPPSLLPAPNLLGSRRRLAPTSFLAPGTARPPTSLDLASLHHHLLHPIAAVAPAACVRLRHPPGAGCAHRPTPPATRAPTPNRWLAGLPGNRWLVLPLATASSPAVHLRHLLKVGFLK